MNIISIYCVWCAMTTSTSPDSRFPTWFWILAAETCSCSATTALVKSNTDVGDKFWLRVAVYFLSNMVGSRSGPCLDPLQQFLLSTKICWHRAEKKGHSLTGTKRNRPSDVHILWPYSGTWRHFCLVSNLIVVCSYVLSCQDAIVFPDLTCYCAEYKVVTDGSEGLNYKK